MMTDVDNMIDALQSGATFANPQTPKIAQLTSLGQSHLDDCTALLLTLDPLDPTYLAVTQLQVSLTAFLVGPSSTLNMLQVHTDFLSGAGDGKFPHAALASITATIPTPAAMGVLGGLGALGALGGLGGLNPANTLRHLSFPSALGAMSGGARVQSGGALFVGVTVGVPVLPACPFINNIMGSVTGALDPVLNAIAQGLADMNDILHQAYDYIQKLEDYTNQVLNQITEELTGLVNTVLQSMLSNMAGLLGAMSLDPCLGQVLGAVAPGLITQAIA